MKATDDELHKMGIKNIEQENVKLNIETQKASDEIAQLYNSKIALEERKKAFIILQNYLFKDKINK